MEDWGNYELSDLVLFTADTWYREVQLYNEAVWPAQIAALAASLALFFLMLRRSESGRLAALLLAAAWIGPAWGWFFTRHAFINWVAPYYGWAFVAEALLLVLIGGLAGRLNFAGPLTASQKAGMGLLLFAIVAQPLLGLIEGRPFVQAEIFGLMPDPTVVATLGILLAADRPRFLLLVVPVLWCAVSGATLWALGSPVFFVPPAAALIVLVLSLLRAVRRAGGEYPGVRNGNDGC